jgi:hypothetical protein
MTGYRFGPIGGTDLDVSTVSTLSVGWVAFISFAHNFGHRTNPRTVATAILDLLTNELLGSINHSGHSVIMLTLGVGFVTRGTVLLCISILALSTI